MSQHEPDQIFAFHQRRPLLIGTSHPRPHSHLGPNIRLPPQTPFQTLNPLPLQHELHIREPRAPPRHPKYLTLLSSRSALQAQTSDKAYKRQAQTVAIFQQAWDVVDAKTNALATQSTYINSIAQEIASVYRTHDTRPNKLWDTICASLIYELQEALRTRQRLRSERKDAEDRAEQWEARYVIADRRWKERHQDAMHLRETYERMHNEYMAGEAIREVFMRDMAPVRERVNDRFEARRVQRINLALEREGVGNTGIVAPTLG